MSHTLNPPLLTQDYNFNYNIWYRHPDTPTITVIHSISPAATNNAEFNIEVIHRFYHSSGDTLEQLQWVFSLQQQLEAEESFRDYITMKLAQEFGIEEEKLKICIDSKFEYKEIFSKEDYLEGDERKLLEEEELKQQQLESQFMSKL